MTGLLPASGCTDASALNFNHQASHDDGSCVGSMYDLSGVYEVRTVLHRRLQWGDAQA